MHFGPGGKVMRHLWSLIGLSLIRGRGLAVDAVLLFPGGNAPCLHGGLFIL